MKELTVKKSRHGILIGRRRLKIGDPGVANPTSHRLLRCRIFVRAVQAVTDSACRQWARMRLRHGGGDGRRERQRLFNSEMKAATTLASAELRRWMLVIRWWAERRWWWWAFRFFLWVLLVWLITISFFLFLLCFFILSLAFPREVKRDCCRKWKNVKTVILIYRWKDKKEKRVR